MDSRTRARKLTNKVQQTEIQPMISVADFADLMSTTRDTVHRWIEQGKIGRVARIGKIIRINAADAQAFIDEHTLFVADIKRSRS